MSMCRYGGPSSQLVSYQWRVDWATFLCSSKGYVFISLDVRGSGYQGDNHRKVVHRQLSKVEVGDVMYVIRYNVLIIVCVILLWNILGNI